VLLRTDLGDCLYLFLLSAVASIIPRVLKRLVIMGFQG
jgi:hypothetical protein